VEHHHPRHDPERFERLNRLFIPMWNVAYYIPEKKGKKKAAERIITSLEPLNVALEDFFSHSDSEPLPNVWSVIMWWLRSPFYRNIFEPAPLVSRSVCVEQLKKIEGGLRGSEELLNKEKADMIKKWLLREAPEDINQARRYEGWKNLYFRSQ
jgi:hypothetical protein